jgi:hypothetical protein
MTPCIGRREFITLLGGASRCALSSRRCMVGFVSNRSPKRGYFKAEKLSRERVGSLRR